MKIENKRKEKIERISSPGLLPPLLGPTRGFSSPIDPLVPPCSPHYTWRSHRGPTNQSHGCANPFVLRRHVDPVGQPTSTIHVLLVLLQSPPCGAHLQVVLPPGFVRRVIGSRLPCPQLVCSCPRAIRPNRTSRPTGLQNTRPLVERLCRPPIRERTARERGREFRRRSSIRRGPRRRNVCFATRVTGALCDPAQSVHRVGD